jgi:hypothetical protein
MKIKITFAGSFQCRLATDPDDTSASPNVPAPEGSPHGSLGKGWTYAYKEEKFDRVIRLSKPHALRNAMVDPWEDAKVTMVEASRSLGLYMSPVMDAPLWDDILLMPVLTDPLMNQVVSLGDAKFASATPGGGTGDGHEVLEDFAFSIGGMLFQARQVGKTKGTGVNYLGDAVKAEYKQKKTALVKAFKNSMDQTRRKLVTEYYKDEPEERGGIPRHIQTYASFFTMHADMPNIPLTQVQVTGGRGVAWLTRQPGLVWKLSLNFGRYDGDTLTGKIKGVLEGRDSRW